MNSPPKYDRAHRQKREAWRPRVEAGEVDCSRCHQPIEPGAPWDLDHDDDEPTAYNGPAHSACNRGAGGRKARARERARDAQPRASREW